MGSPNASTRLGRMAVLVFCATVSLLAAHPQRAPKPLSKDDVIRLLEGDVSPKRVGEMARERGINFELRAEVEGELRRAGATDELIGVLRGMAPKPPAAPELVVHSKPGEAEVYVDDVRAGKTSPEGVLKIPDLSPGTHRVRLSLQGYADYEQTVAFAAGQPATIEAGLEAAKPPAAKPPAAPELVVHSKPGDAEVYVDDVRMGKTSPEGVLKIPDLSPGTHRVRVSLEGYADYEQGVALAAGQSATFEASLEAAKPNVVPPPAIGAIIGANRAKPLAEKAEKKVKRWTGVVSDDHCGLKHSVPSDEAAACIRKCADGGAKYVLVVRGKIYNLDPQEKFAEFAGQRVTVTGFIIGNTITAREVTGRPLDYR